MEKLLSHQAGTNRRREKVIKWLFYAMKLSLKKDQKGPKRLVFFLQKDQGPVPPKRQDHDRSNVAGKK